MWYRFEATLDPLLDLIHSFDRQEWIAVFVGALIVGFFCMRGFGSRTRY